MTRIANTSSYTIALAGNPNAGKTSVFNALTGMSQHVGNWPGVTVERLEGRYSFEGRNVTVVDLPGIYSLNAYSVDEAVSRKYILTEKPSVVVNIVDATNLERNLYLTSQLLEMRVPMVVVLNMMDIAVQRRISIEVAHLAAHLDCPVIPMIASKRQGVDELRAAIDKIAKSSHIPATFPIYDEEVEEAIDMILPSCQAIALDRIVSPRWLAVKMLEKDAWATLFATGDLAGKLETQITHIERHTGEKIDLVIADGRYGFVHGLVADVLHLRRRLRRTLSDAIDRVVLNRVVGIPMFLFIMYCMFFLTINIGDPFINFFDRICGTLFIDGPHYLMAKTHAPNWVHILLADGVGGGIQTIATLTPPIFFIFLCLSILEDSGVMARAAFIADRLLRKIGLPGKAFIPLMVGFGCTVPGILATRTLESRRDRLLTVMINPFMSCGARLPVYVLFVVAFFPTNGVWVVFLIYIIGIVLAVFTGLLLKHTILRGEASATVMELPPYHIPTMSGVMHHTWNRLKGFVFKAGKAILLVVIILNCLTGFTVGKENIISKIGKTITPVFGPMGIQEDNWPASVGLCTGIFAKESVVGTLNSIYSRQQKEQAATSIEADEDFNFWSSIGEAFLEIPHGFAKLGAKLIDYSGVSEEIRSDSDDVFSALRKNFKTRSAAFAYMLFVLIYAPCIAAIAAIFSETNWKWTAFSIVYLTSLAWLVSTAYYQASMFFEQPGVSAAWLAGTAVIILILFSVLRVLGRRIRVEYTEK